MHLVARQDDWKSLRTFCPHCIELRRVDPQHVLVQEQDCAECLRLGARRKVVSHGQMRQERLDFRPAHLLGMAFPVM
jgi:hypothetical protein